MSIFGNITSTSFHYNGGDETRFEFDIGISFNDEDNHLINNQIIMEISPVNNDAELPLLCTSGYGRIFGIYTDDVASIEIVIRLAVNDTIYQYITTVESLTSLEIGAYMEFEQVEDSNEGGEGGGEELG